ncbi:glycosyltransferase family 4 protein [Planctomycetaceae bacterium SH139]
MLTGVDAIPATRPRRLGLMILFGQSYTGGPRVVKNLVAMLDRNYYEPFVITNKESELTADLRELDCRFTILPIARELEASGGRSIRGLRSQLPNMVRSLSTNREVSRILEREQIELLWTRNIKAVLLAGFAARRAKLPLIWDIGMEKTSRGLVRHLHNLGFKLATRVVTEGRSVAGTIFTEQQLTKYKEKLTVIRSGIPLDRLREIEREADCLDTSPREDGLRIINLASVCDRKNQHFILTALAPLLAANKDLRLDFVGPIVEAEYAAKLQHQIERARLQSQVQLSGWCADAPQQLVRSDLFVLGSRIEGVPYSILEAMHAGVPVVSTPCGGVPDVIEDQQTGLLCSATDPASMRAAVTRLVTDSTLRDRLSSNAQAFVKEHYSVEQWSTNYTKLFHELLQLQR